MHIEMKDSDFSESDCQLASELYEMYDDSIIENSEVLVIGNRHFLLLKMISENSAKNKKTR